MVGKVGLSEEVKPEEKPGDEWKALRRSERTLFQAEGTASAKALGQGWVGCDWGAAGWGRGTWRPRVGLESCLSTPLLPTGAGIQLHTCLPPEGQRWGGCVLSPQAFSRWSPLWPHLWPVQKSGCHLPCLVTVIIDGLNGEERRLYNDGVSQEPFGLLFWKGGWQTFL